MSMQEKSLTPYAKFKAALKSDAVDIDISDLSFLQASWAGLVAGLRGKSIVYNPTRADSTKDGAVGQAGTIEQATKESASPRSADVTDAAVVPTQSHGQGGNAKSAKKKVLYVCKRCGTSGIELPYSQSMMGCVEMICWPLVLLITLPCLPVFFIFLTLLIIELVVRHKFNKVISTFCPSCKCGDLIPQDSPMGAKIMSETTRTKN